MNLLDNIYSIDTASITYSKIIKRPLSPIIARPDFDVVAE